MALDVVVDAVTDIAHVSLDAPSEGGEVAGVTACDRLFFWKGTGVSFAMNTTNFRAYRRNERTVPTCLECIGATEDQCLIRSRT